MISTIIRRDMNELSKEGTDVLVTSIGRVLERKKFVVLAIPGGRSIRGLWESLATERRIPWAKMHIFMADERIVPPTHDDSNFKLAYNCFLEKLIDSGTLPAENVHPFNPDKGLDSYNEVLSKLGGAADIIILGVGEDGHVGALYPNHHSVKSDARGYISMVDSPKPPAQRITLSRKTMVAASVAILLFVGEGKRDAYLKFKSGNDAEECPSRLAKRIEYCYVLTDMQ